MARSGCVEIGQDDQETFRRGRAAALGGFAVQVVLAAATAATVAWSGQAALTAAAWHMVGGLPIWVVLAGGLLLSRCLAAWGEPAAVPSGAAAAVARERLAVMNTGLTIDQLALDEVSAPASVLDSLEAVTSAETNRSQQIVAAEQERARILGEAAGLPPAWVGPLLGWRSCGASCAG